MKRKLPSVAKIREQALKKAKSWHDPETKAELEKAWPKDEAENQANRATHEVMRDAILEQGGEEKEVPDRNPAWAPSHFKPGLGYAKEVPFGTCNSCGENRHVGMGIDGHLCEDCAMKARSGFASVQDVREQNRRSSGFEVPSYADSSEPAWFALQQELSRQDRGGEHKEEPKGIAAPNRVRWANSPLNRSHKIQKSELVAAEKEASKPFHGYNPERHARTGGLSEKGRAKMNRETGSKLKAPVTKKNPKGKEAARKKSFCARMSGVRGPTSKEGKLTPKGAALKRWRCSKSESDKIETDEVHPEYLNKNSVPHQKVIDHLYRVDQTGDEDFLKELSGEIQKFPKWQLKQVPIKHLDSGESRSEDIVQEYADMSPDTRPPIIALPSKTGFWVADGGHRTQAAQKRGEDKILAYVPLTPSRLKKDLMPGGVGDDMPDSDFDPKQLEAGVQKEMREHGLDRKRAKEITKDHLAESLKNRSPIMKRAKQNSLAKMALVHSGPTPKTVWVVQNAKGQGPYTAGAEWPLPQTHNIDTTNPPPDFDFEPTDLQAWTGDSGSSRAQRNVLKPKNKEYRFGFEHPDHAKEWFGEEGLKALGEQGFALKAVPAREIRRSQSGRQVMWLPHESGLNKRGLMFSAKNPKQAGTTGTFAVDYPAGIHDGSKIDPSAQGSRRDAGSIKVLNPDTGESEWHEARAGMVMDNTHQPGTTSIGTPISSRRQSEPATLDSMGKAERSPILKRRSKKDQSV